jgi:hypothetical protein
MIDIPMQSHSFSATNPFLLVSARCLGDDGEAVYLGASKIGK